MGYGNTWVEIDLDQLEKNVRAIRKQAAPAKVNCVIKANAYGHGSVVVGKHLEPFTDYFSVANFNEVKELRKHGIKKPILCLGYIDREEYAAFPEYQPEVTIYNKRQAEILSKTMEEASYVCPIHIKVDTGMSRLGFQPGEQSVQDILAISAMPGLRIAGIFTHFACADAEDLSFTEKQYQRYRDFADTLKEAGVAYGLRHVANSAGILEGRFKEDMVRAGIVLYGINPNPRPTEVDAQTAMRFCAKVASIRTIEKGAGVSYGQTWTADKQTKIATVTIGYADGYFRSFSSKAEMIIHGKPAKILGRVCMDQTMVDITGRDDVKIGDTVILYDKDYEQTNMYHMAELADTITYELFCAVSRRVCRVYKRGGEVVETVNYLEG